MYARVLELTISAVMLTYGAVGALAQERACPHQFSNKRKPNPRARKDPA